MHFIRNSEACTKCGACAADCSPLRYGLTASQTAIADPADPQCERCGHCYSVCPRGAIDVVEEPAIPSLFAGADLDREISPGSLFTLLARRRSERRFYDRPVSLETVSALLAAAAQIPSGGNARTVECKVLVDNDVRHGLLASIRGFYHRLLWIARSRFARFVVGALLGKAAGAFLNDPEYRRRFIALVDAIDDGIDPVFYGAPVVLLFHSKAVMPTPEEDAVLAAYNVALVAATLGLGSCFVSMAQKALSASRAVRRASGLAKDQRVLAVLAVGHPVVSRRRPVFRPSVPAESPEACV
jgi:nitroreductase/Pyruvate/2-oxoacid:ferredoxin oxidoreductase delta subunit